MKRIILYILIISLLIFTPGCHRNVIYSNSKYQILQRDDQYIIKFSHQYTKDSVDAVYERGWIGAPEFKNVSEMMEAIKKGNMDDFYLAGIAYNSHKYYYDQQPLFNIENPLDLILPAGTEIESVTWSGRTYSFSLDSDLLPDKRGAYAYASVLTQANVQDFFNTYYREELDGYPNSTIVLPKRDEKERNGKEIRTPFKKYLRYEIVSDTQTLHVLETYYVKHYEGSPDEDIPTSEHIPYEVQMLGTGELGSFYVYFCGITARPSAEWLSSFSLTPLEG